MHAPIEQLLNLRDGTPVDASVQAHVSHCLQCAQSLRDLDAMRGRLLGLAQPEGTPRAWAEVRASVASRTAASHRRGVLTRAALAASIAVLAVATGWRLHQSPDAAPPATAQERSQAPAAARLAQLRSQSQALEELLAELPQQPAIERAGTALPIDTLETQVQWLDHQLLLNADDLQPEAAERLWRERVQTMNSLVRLRYAEAQRVAM